MLRIVEDDAEVFAVFVVTDTGDVMVYYHFELSHQKTHLLQKEYLLLGVMTQCTRKTTTTINNNNNSIKEYYVQIRNGPVLHVKVSDGVTASLLQSLTQ